MGATVTTSPVPLFTPLGYAQANGAHTRYYIRLGDVVRGYRGVELIGLAFLLELHPDAEHWREMFPRGKHCDRIDTCAAAAWLVKECRAAGIYQPAVPLRGVGRPRKQVSD